MKMQSARRTAAQAGFTLIELIVVIVILGILAATALPKFADMGGDARFAALRGAMGAMQATSAMAHGKSLVTGSASGNVDMEGTSVPMAFGYPTASATFATAAGLSSSEWTVAATATAVTVRPLNLDSSKTATCVATYTAPTAAGGVPTLTLTASAAGC